MDKIIDNSLEIQFLQNAFKKITGLLFLTEGEKLKDLERLTDIALKLSTQIAALKQAQYLYIEEEIND